MDVKNLKKLAAACRKAGIKTFKSGDVEFTLADAPVRPIKASKKALVDDAGAAGTDEKGWDTFTDEEKLFWSAPNPETQKQ